MFQLVLSLVGRKKLVAVNVILNAIQVCLGASLIFLAIYACTSCRLYPPDRSLLRLVFTMVAFYGVLVCVLGVQGVRLSATYFSSSLRPRLGLELAVWIVVATLATIIGIGFMFALPSTMASFLGHLQNSMYRGMTQYLQDSSWKTFYDDVQVNLGCCGIADSSDWRTTSWIPLDLVKENSRTVLDYTKADGRTLPPVVPFSCCLVGTKTQCLHDHVQQKELFLRVKDTPNQWWEGIHKVGCFPKLNATINQQVYGAIILILITCIIFLVNIALSGYVHLRSKGRGIDGMFRRTKNANSKQRVSGGSSKYKGDGDSSKYKGDGDDSKYKGDGDSSKYKGDGDDSKYKGDGDSSKYKGDGDDSTYKGDGDSSKYKGEGDSSKYRENGSSKYKENGNSTKYKRDGDSSKYKEDGDSSKYRENGSSKYKENGNSSKYKRDGDSSKYNEDGDSSKYKENGSSKYKGDGDSSKYREDGDSSRYKENVSSKYKGDGDSLCIHECFRCGVTKACDCDNSQYKAKYLECYECGQPMTCMESRQIYTTEDDSGQCSSRGWSQKSQSCGTRRTRSRSKKVSYGDTTSCAYTY